MVFKNVISSDLQYSITWMYHSVTASLLLDIWVVFTICSSDVCISMCV